MPVFRGLNSQHCNLSTVGLTRQQLNSFVHQLQVTRAAEIVSGHCSFAQLGAHREGMRHHTGSEWICVRVTQQNLMEIGGSNTAF